MLKQEELGRFIVYLDMEISMKGFCDYSVARDYVELITGESEQDSNYILYRTLQSLRCHVEGEKIMSLGSYN